MSQHIYDSKSQQLVAFEPREAGRVGMYVCGPTVQSAPHIGHLRSALVYDQMRRWFVACGQEVTLVRNVTDIDDKILANAAAGQAAGGSETWWALASRVEGEFAAAYRAVGVSEPTVSPRATGHILEMDALIERLFEAGYAYETADGSVYFDTAKWADYGELTRQSIEQMAEGEADELGKRNRCDFALWKANRPDDEAADAAWQISRGGKGRPGWHIECSAMATRFLGSEFDIHGGGRDLRFPHHENELAQSRAAGDGFARYWVHNGLVNVDGQKMSKSLGNSLFAADLLDAAEPLVVRYFLGSAHYRSELTYSETSLAEAAAAVARIGEALVRAERAAGVEVPEPFDVLGAGAGGNAGAGTGAAWATEKGETLAEKTPQAFKKAMFDDFALPQALAALHGSVRTLNTALDGGDTAVASAAADELVAMLGVLHLDPRHPHWAGGAAGENKTALALDKLLQELIAARLAARSAKDWQRSDEIRDQLAAAGIELKDTANDTIWSLK